MKAAEKRGRKSAASAMVVAEPLQVIERQRPPYDLSDEEVEVWAAVVNAEPADWFSPSTAPLLAQFCRHVVHARRIGELIERMLCDLSDPPSLGEYDKLLKMQERESRALAQLATKMRIAQQSTRTHRGNSRSISPGRTPWQK